MTSGAAILYAWIVWVLSWFVAAVWSRRTAARPGLGNEAVYRILVLTGAVLMFTLPISHAVVETRMYPYPHGAGGWLLAALVAGGFLFTWWARLHLGSLWSGSITRKEDHHIVDSGPYGLVRHPIYTGLILALIATSIAQARPISFVGAAVMILGFVVKARLEERFLRSELGADAYGDYARRVPMLVPFTKLSSE